MHEDFNSSSILNDQSADNYQKVGNQYFSKQRYLENGGFISSIFFSWISSLLTYGNKVEIDQCAIPNLPEKEKTKIKFNQLFQTFKNMPPNKRKGMRLTKAILKSLKKEFFIIFFLTFVYSGLQIAQPILTKNIISYIQSGARSLKISLAYFLSIFMITFGMSLLIAQIYYKFSLLGFNLSNTLSLLIYDKTLKHPLITEKQFTTGKIINYSQVDAQRMTHLGFQLIGIILAPIQIVAIMFLLYLYIGIVFFVGISVMILMILLTLIFTKLSVRANDQLLKKKDARMKVSEQILQIIKFIKVNALQKHLFRKLNKKKEEELKCARKSQLYTVVTTFVYWFSPTLIISMTFLIYTKEQSISTELAFTVIMLFNILQYPIKLLPSSISYVIQIWSSVKRIQHYLSSIELPTNLVRYTHSNDDNQNCIIISNGNFYFGKQEKKLKYKKKINQQALDMQKEPLISDIMHEQSEKNDACYLHALKDINVKFKAKKITMIIGDVGSGKTSLLYCILNEMTSFSALSASIEVNGSISYCSQKPWVMSGTIKQNILFTLPYNQQRLEQAIYYSCLSNDLKFFTKGIDTYVTEKGMNLSGGQKARISLARALYSDRQIYLLDDILSAVDTNVAKFLIKETIKKCLKNKTVIMPTHATNYLNQADQILIMKNGRIIKQGTYNEVKLSKQYLDIKQIEEAKSQDKKYKEDQLITQEQRKISQQFNKIEIAHSKKDESRQSDQIDKIIEYLIIPEDKRVGKVSFHVYKTYLKINGGWKFVISVLGCVFISAALSIQANIQIQRWCEDSDNNIYIYQYLGMSLISTFFTASRATILVLSGIRQGRTLHKRMIKSLLYASLANFYNRVPIGRILNRLSKDLRQIDEQIGDAVGSLLVNFFKLISGLGICIYASTPLVAIPCLLIAFICIKLSQYYLKSQRECIRLQNISASPIASGFTSAVHGVATIRAYGVTQQFLKAQTEKNDVNKRNKVAREALQSWFSIRLAILSFVINMSAIAYCIFVESVSGSVAGLLLAYSLSTNQDLVDTVFSYVSLQTKMIAIERADNFTKIQPEPGYVQYCKNWWTKDQGYDSNAILQGNIQFKNFSAKYHEHSSTILKNFTLSIKAGEKIGIAGRTGGGKSTLFNCLVRLLDHTEGCLEIDGKKIIDYNLKDLRSCITMIDQDPTLIQGSFRENIDPAFQYTDEQIENIVRECNLSQLIENKGGIDAQITNESLSVGEKQLLCICRGLLKQTKIVLIDEATANIDTKTDQVIQKVIQSKFKNSTVLTIAHRLSTLKNTDKILILVNGRILEWGTTNFLLKKPDSIFREMCEGSNQSYLE